MTNENTYAMVSHYNGYALLLARLGLEKYETDSAEESRRRIIKNLGTLESNDGLKNYIQFLKGSKWNSPEKINEAQVKSRELVTK